MRWCDTGAGMATVDIGAAATDPIGFVAGSSGMSWEVSDPGTEVPPAAADGVDDIGAGCVCWCDTGAGVLRVNAFAYHDDELDNLLVDCLGGIPPIKSRYTRRVIPFDEVNVTTIDF